MISPRKHLLCCVLWVLCGLCVSWAGERVVITERGAVGDAHTLNTTTIQSVIDGCASKGGGEVIVPRGIFVTGSIFLKQGVNLVIEKDGVLKGSQNTNDYPWINTRIAGLEMKWPAALVNADGLGDVRILGDGVIDGSGERWWREYWDARAKETNKVDPHFKIPRPRLVHLMNCTNVFVGGLTLKDSAFWNLQLTYCDQVEVRRVTVRAPLKPIKAASSDGIDVDSSRNVLIASCDIECGDDAICLKAGRDADGLRVNRATENVEIVNCRVGNAAGLVVLGQRDGGWDTARSRARLPRGCGLRGDRAVQDARGSRRRGGGCDLRKYYGHWHGSRVQFQHGCVQLNVDSRGVPCASRAGQSDARIPQYHRAQSHGAALRLGGIAYRPERKSATQSHVGECGHRGWKRVHCA